MAKKVAKLVAVSLITRVVVDEDATEAQILEASKAGLNAKIANDELSENLDYIQIDNECPFGTFDTDK